MMAQGLCSILYCFHNYFAVKTSPVAHRLLYESGAEHETETSALRFKGSNAYSLAEGLLTFAKES